MARYTIGLCFVWICIYAVVSKASLVENFSFGRGQRISTDGKNIAGWISFGEGYSPEILSDRVVITPPYPGHRRGALWASSPSYLREWTAQIGFRSNGDDESDGTLQLWLVKDGSRQISFGSVDSVGRFDGLAIQIDKHGGKGQLRAFLNDGTTDFRQHMDISELLFGRCNFEYRNLGRASTVTIKQNLMTFEVLVDDTQCFETDKVLIPPGNEFGVTASSAENPDSFEIFSFLLEATELPDSGRQYQRNYQAEHRPAQEVKNEDYNPSTGNSDIDAQMKDILNQLQAVTQVTNTLLDELARFRASTDERLNDFSRTIPHRDQVSSVDQRLIQVERTIDSLKVEVRGKDYQGHFTKLQETLLNSHTGVIQQVHESSHRVLSSAPRLGLFLFLVLGLQFALVVLYIFYKMRRANMPKKYL